MKTVLGAVLRLETTAQGARRRAGSRLKKKGFFLRAETAFSEHGLRRVDWADLELVDHWRRYLDHPAIYLRHLTES